MIKCPSCGAANRRGSHFCNECGQPMPAQTSLRCPVCGAANPIGNTYCDQCNARLTVGVIPAAAPGSGEEQLAAPGQDDELSGGLLGHVDGSDRSSPGAPEASSEIPEWLHDLEPEGGKEPLGVQPTPSPPAEEAAAPGQPAPAFGPSEVPEWLLEMAPPEVGGRKQAAPPEQPAAPPAAPGAAEIPDWLLDIAPPDVAAPAGGPAEAIEPAEQRLAEPGAPDTGETLDWLSESGAGEATAPPGFAAAAEVPEEVSAGPAASEGIGLPDWLGEIAAGEGPLAVDQTELGDVSPQPAPETAEVDAGRIPEGLSEIAVDEGPSAPERAAAVELPEAGPSEPLAADEVELPEWLAELEPDAPGVEGAVAEEGAAERPAVEGEKGEAPDWLRGLQPTSVEAPAEAAPAETAPPQVPDWLADLKPETPPGEGPAVSTEKSRAAAGLGPVPAQAQIPEWLEAMRAQPPSPGAVAEDEAVETEGLLEGLRGVLPAEGIETSPPITEPVVPKAGEGAATRAQLLQSLAAPAAGKKPAETRKREVSTGERLVRWLVLAVVVLPIAIVVGWPALAGEELLILTEPQATLAGGLFEAIDGLEPEDVALVAFEYGPGEAGELGVVARPLLWHLHEKGAVIWVGSTRPDGQGLADALRMRIGATEGYTPTYHHYAYQPGGAAGVATMVAEISPDIVLVLAGQVTPVQWWVEQTEALGIDPPVVAAVAASVAPAASPYLATNGGRIEGMVCGLSGAAAYEERMGDVPEPTARLLNGLAAGHIAVAALMVAGALVYGVSGGRKRERE
jgi:hypothetical protein